jgi:N-acetylglucosamine-6-phosphate deacetylase
MKNIDVLDVHTHGIGGYDTKTNVASHILRIAEIHGASGVSEILLSMYPGSIDVMRRQMELVRQAMERQGQGARGKGQSGKTVSRQPSAVSDRDWREARIIGVHLEGPFLNRTCCGALDPGSFVEPREKVFRELVEGFEDIVKVITVAPELKGARALIKKMVSRGIIVSMGHSDATYAEAEAGWKAGARSITHLFNAMRGFHHREPGLAGFGLLNNDIYVEVIADPFHLHPKTVELIFNVKNAEKIILVSDSVRRTGTRANTRAIASHSGGLQGGSAALPESCRRLVTMGLDETVIADASTVNPRRYLGVQC